MLEKLNEKILDEIYKLQIKRQNIIEETGAAITIGPDHIPAKALKEDTTFYFSEGSPVAPGNIIRHPDFIPSFLVLTTEIQAGRIKAETLVLDKCFTLLQKYSKGINQFQQPVYGIKSTNWRNIPSTDIHGNKVKIPKLYTPENGELLLIDGITYEVLSTHAEGPVCVATVREW